MIAVRAIPDIVGKSQRLPRCMNPSAPSLASLIHFLLPRWLNRTHVKKARLLGVASVFGLMVLASDSARAARGDLDLTFNPDVGGASGADVACTAIQPDGKIVIGGTFDTVGGVTRRNVARLQPDGTLDPGFNPDVTVANYGVVNCLAVQVDGKIVLGGYFSTVGGVPRQNLARVGPDGALDTAFNPGASGEVTCLVVQPDGKIIVAGGFGTIAGVARSSIARLNVNGTLDTAFNAVTVGGGWVEMAALQTDGKVVIGGYFASINGMAHGSIARLNANGTLDAGFNAHVDFEVHTVSVQNIGGILLGGYFSTVNGVVRNCTARLGNDGTLDSSFNPNVYDDVWSIANGISDFVLAGDIYSVGGTLRLGVAWFYLFNGSPILPNLQAYGARSVTMQADGGIIVGGYFDTVRGVVRNGLARLLNDGSPIVDILAVVDTHNLKWLRNGPLPEAQDVTFDLSTDGGITWTFLGTGRRRNPGVLSNTGWDLGGLNLPMAGMLRARARIGGRHLQRLLWADREDRLLHESPATVRELETHLLWRPERTRSHRLKWRRARQPAGIWHRRISHSSQPSTGSSTFPLSRRRTAANARETPSGLLRCDRYRAGCRQRTRPLDGPGHEHPESPSPVPDLCVIFFPDRRRKRRKYATS